MMRLTLHLIALAALLGTPAAIAASNDATPSVDTILERVIEQGKREDNAERTFKESYTFTRKKVTEYRNGNGDLKKREEKRRIHLPKAPPPPKVTKTSAQASQKTSDAEKLAKEHEFEKSDFLVGDDMVKRFVFTLVGKEIVNGRPAYVIDFKPANKKLPERNIKDKFINKAAGRAWVDAEDYSIAKADVHLTDRVNVVGGLIGAVWKFKYVLERERTEDGIWFSRDVNWHLEGREVLVQRTIDYHEENTDVKRVWPEAGKTAALTTR